MKIVKEVIAYWKQIQQTIEETKKAAGMENVSFIKAVTLGPVTTLGKMLGIMEKDEARKEKTEDEKNAEFIEMFLQQLDRAALQVGNFPRGERFVLVTWQPEHPVPGDVIAAAPLSSSVMPITARVKPSAPAAILRIRPFCRSCMSPML